MRGKPGNSLRRAGLPLILLGVFFVSGLFAEFLAPYRYDSVRFDLSYMPPVWPTFHEGRLEVPVLTVSDPVLHRFQRRPGQWVPVRFLCQGEGYTWMGVIRSRMHLFCVDSPGRLSFLGLDVFGRDLWSRLLYGIRFSFLLSFSAVTLSFIIGVLAGLAAGTGGEWIDQLLMRTGEVFMAIPSLYLLMGIRAIFPPGLSTTEVTLIMTGALAFVGWAGLARVVRGVARSLRQEEFVLAARSVGVPWWGVWVRHILPNMSYYLLIALTLSIPGFIVGEAGLSFLGLGVSEPHPSLGNILAESQSLPAMKAAPWLLLSGVVIVCIVILFNLLGDRLRENGRIP
ncbi:Oligopeptide transport system permease protein OppC [Leptospirillum ferriphilum]|jgi:peptide/nickel transport system permease protein|uniref:Oligopeptide transport system permease protein OppC n=2 Tax=Leptospirillum TaxID=179 RepID=A0A094WBB2_9BACT|nr:ABC transporter permease [Leptospirillum ferriphilum]EDZ39776.1 MAG: Putative oligopeptide ABC transporter, permease protein [Leptospirillum sp. Group II '5-way CG']KGA94838.1 Oligopeptide transport system permease protein OppC [Leptospirillum ferriphilum]